MPDMSSQGSTRTPTSKAGSNAPSGHPSEVSFVPYVQTLRRTDDLSRSYDYTVGPARDRTCDAISQIIKADNQPTDAISLIVKGYDKFKLTFDASKVTEATQATVKGLTDMLDGKGPNGEAWRQAYESSKTCVKHWLAEIQDHGVRGSGSATEILHRSYQHPEIGLKHSTHKASLDIQAFILQDAINKMTFDPSSLCHPVRVCMKDPTSFVMGSLHPSPDDEGTVKLIEEWLQTQLAPVSVGGSATENTAPLEHN